MFGKISVQIYMGFDNQCDVSSLVQVEVQVELSKEGFHVIFRISRHVF